MDRPRYTFWWILSAAAALSSGCDTSTPSVKPLPQVADVRPALLDVDGMTGRHARRVDDTRIVRAAYPAEPERQSGASDEAALAPLPARKLNALPIEAASDGRQAQPGKRSEPASTDPPAVGEKPSDEESPDAEGSRLFGEPTVAVVPPLPDVHFVEQDRNDDALPPRPLDLASDQSQLHDDSPVAEPVDSIREAPTTTELPWARSRPHNAEMAAVLAGADDLTRHGFDLAGRGALYSARAQFTQALQRIAQAQDAEQETRIYTRSLAAGLTALKEARDFVIGTSPDQETDLAFVIKSHRTPILQGQDLSETTTLVALRRYYTFAQEQLALAAGSDSAGSMALYGLGRLAASGSRPGDANDLESTAQAMVFYQAALLADGKNYLAANELGVLLARCGKPERAKEMFLRSLAVHPQPAVWHNLAKVHERLGETALAASARSQIRGQAVATGAAPSVRWVDPANFAQMTPPSEGLTAPTPAPTPATASPTPPAQPNSEKKGLSEWLPWNRPAQR